MTPPRKDLPKSPTDASYPYDVVKEHIMLILTRYGIEVDSPIEVQKDFQFLRESRETAKAFRRRITMGFLMLLLLLVLVLFAELQTPDPDASSLENLKKLF